ncbi:MAG: hypothetical protein U9O49_03380 [Candidatus Thermoplasmatota archaeon]|nr:hypothetical protein [Candidatus Thermoplasmatota archaeon]
MKLKHYSLIFSISGIAVLYFLSILAQPTVIEISDISNYDGKEVIVDGTVTKYSFTSYGSQIITIRDNNSSAAVFLEGVADVEYGDRIRATGNVQKFGEGWEIVVDNEKFIEVIEKWKNISIPLWQLSLSPERYSGLNVNVAGYLDSLYDTYLYLTDLDEEYKIIIFYDPYMYNSLQPGQKITIFGKFEFNTEEFRYNILVTEPTHEILIGES